MPAYSGSPEPQVSIWSIAASSWFNRIAHTLCVLNLGFLCGAITVAAVKHRPVLEELSSLAPISVVTGLVWAVCYFWLQLQLQISRPSKLPPSSTGA
jgi:hypothetical protein